MPVKCSVCGYEDVHEIVSHIRKQHNLNPKQYLDKFPGSALVSEEVSKLLSSVKLCVDDKGRVWRFIENFCDCGFSGFGKIIPDETAPVLDKGYYFQPDVTRLLYYAFLENQRVLIVGPRGCGKTDLVKNICAVMGWGLRRVNFNGQVTPRSFFGSLRAGSNGTYFLYGSLPLAMMRGECLLLDEISFIDPDMAAGLHEPMEIGGRLVLLENGGEIIYPHPDFRIIGTDNVGASGDLLSVYHGTKQMNAAFVDRWSFQINMTYLPKDVELKVLMNRVPRLPLSLAEKMVELAYRSREESVDSVLFPVSFRQLYEWARLTLLHKDVKLSYSLAVLNKASEEDAATLGILYDHIF